MEGFIQFFSHPFFIIFGGVVILYGLISLLYTIFLIINGTLPALVRLQPKNR